MVRVAIAGASTGIGRHIVDAVLESRKHECVVLSRAENPELSKLGVEVIPVNYEDQSSLVSALQGVHTLISTVFFMTAEIDIALIDAAETVGVKRFIPDSWVIREIIFEVDLYKPKAEVHKRLENSSLEWAAVDCGIFMNYYAVPTKGIGYLKPLKLWVDVENCTSDIPGTGDEPFTLTTCEDIGKQVVATFDLPQWPKGVIKLQGDVTSLNKLIAIAESVRGKKFEATRHSEDAIKRQDTGSLKDFIQQLSLAIIQGKFGIQSNVPGLPKPVLLEEFMNKWWGRGEGSWSAPGADAEE